MNNIQIDQSAKLALEYIEKLHGQIQNVKSSTNPKRQKLNETSIALRPSDFPGISTQQLCDILIRFAYDGTYVNNVFHDHILDLVVDKSLAWDQVIRSILKTDFKRLYIKCQLCDLVRDMIHFVQIKAFNDSSQSDDLLEVLKKTCLFLSGLIIDLLDDEDGLEAMQIENDDSCKPYQKPLDALNALIHDDLCGALLSIKDSAEITEHLEYCVDAIVKLVNPDRDATSLIELVYEKHVANCQPIHFQYSPEALSLFDFKNPSIRILIPIFACFKSHKSSKSIADTIQVISEIMRVSGDDVIFDIIHATVLLKCEDSLDLLHLPKQHRADFLWQATTFFYKKLPHIIGFLVEGGGVTSDDVRFALNRALTDLSMMFDAADASWQNASFLTLLNELEPIIGKDSATPLRQRRRDHMRTIANLAPLAESDEKPIENTDVDKLLTAVKEVMNLHFGQSEEFWKLFLDKITCGNRDDFDAVTAVLTSEGKLLEAGKVYAMRNLEAQQPSENRNVDERIRTFDDTFLLLSRIVICNPSLSIGLFVNGGPGITDAERAIFYKWSMWFVKRVERKRKTEDDSDTERLRDTAKMLWKLASLEIGIPEEIEEDEEIAVVEVEENVEVEEEVIPVDEPANLMEEGTNEGAEIVMKDEDLLENFDVQEQPGMGPVEEEVETMDTAEAHAEPTNNIEQHPLHNQHFENMGERAVPPAELEENSAKLELPQVTWKELHCPLPRITKSRGRMYLTQLKEGHHFWNREDKGLNIGSIVASIPMIGKLLVEEHEMKQGHRIDRRAAEEHMNNIINAIDSMPCLFLCLVQWLDCEKDSPARTSLATTMRASLEKRITSLAASSSDSLPKWKFVQSTVQQIMDELTGKNFAFPEVTLTVFSAARRYCPFVARNEKPDFLKLKHVWHYMRKQAWASPHALRLLEHANIAGEYNAWSHGFMNKTIKCGCGDLMKSSVDMIFSFLMMDDLNSIIRIHESLMDFWLIEDTTQCQMDGRFDPLSMRIVIRLMSHVMLMAEWTLDRLVNNGPPLPDPLPFKEAIETPEPEDPLHREKWVFLLRSLLDRTVNRFFKILRNGLLLSNVNTTIQLIKTIAGSADCRAKHLLVRRIPPSLIFQLAYIEPASVDYALMNVFCDPENQEHTQLKVLFLCALRRAKIL